MINILINAAYQDLIDPAVLEKAATAALQARNDNSFDGDLSVVLEDDPYLHDLNKQYLDVDSPTDVLSFPSGEEGVDPETGVLYLGDVIISYPRALEQSAAAGHAVLDELQLLVVHGVLHLRSFDHAEPEEKAEMWSLQAEILRGLGVRISRLPE